MSYGYELILDLHECDPETFSRESIENFFIELCEKIKMERDDLHFWDYDTQEEFDNAPTHLKGISAIQFITTSDIRIHTLYDLRKVFLNVFSCKGFDPWVAEKLAREWFKGNVVSSNMSGRI